MVIPPALIAAWPLTFLAWPFVLAAAAAAIPVVLHMIHRQRAKQAPFPTLRFLRISVEKTRRRKRVQDVLLMLVRAAVLVLIALGLARPTVTHLRVLLGSAPSAVVLLIDNSASMGAVDRQQSRFELAVGAASQILDELGPSDQVALLLTGGPPHPELGQLDSTQERIRQVLPQCRVSYEGADLGARIREARRLLAESDAPNKQIYVLTDMQARSWDGLKQETGDGGLSQFLRSKNGTVPFADSQSATSPAGADTGSSPGKENPREGDSPIFAAQKSGQSPAVGADIPVMVVDCGGEPLPNVAVEGVEVKAPVPVAGLPIAIGADLWNTSEHPQQRMVELVIDGQKEQSSPLLSLPPRGRIKHDFAFTFHRSGLHQGEVRLVGQDGSKLDDLRFFSLELDQGIPVAIVKPRRHEIPCLEETFYIERAFAPAKAAGSAITVTPLVADQLRSEPLGKYKVLFCANLPALEPETARRIGEYVAGGGNLVWFAGDRVEPDAYNRMNASAREQLLPAPLVDVRAVRPAEGRDSWHVNFLDAKYPALATLVEPPKLFESILVFKHVRMAADKVHGGWVLARLDDGEPLLVQRQVERGKVLFLGTAAQTGWSNLPLRPIFLPLLVRLTFALAAAEQTGHDLLAGTPLVLPLDKQPGPVNIELQRPGNETLRLRSQSEKDPGSQIFRYADTHEIGNYLVRGLDAGGPPPRVFSVNTDPGEADPTTIGRDEIQSRLDPAPVIFADDPTDLSATFARLREGKSLWGFFLWAVLAILVFETFLANRWSPKERSFPSPSGSTMRAGTKEPSSLT